MKIAFVSFEYPPDTAYGGIATYVYQAARMMVSHGHQVEVFVGSPSRTMTTEEDGVIVHRFLTTNPSEFCDVIVDYFVQRHQSLKFDVVEGPDYNADARKVIERIPDLPLVLKLHTPTCLCSDANDWKLSLLSRLRIVAGSLLRGRKPTYSYLFYSEIDVIERNHAKTADEIAAPSLAIGKRLERRWKLDTNLISYFPYPYNPSEAMISIDPYTRTDTITFIGRIEARKGVVSLSQAIPIILGNYPKARFRFVGRTSDSDLENRVKSNVLQVKNSVEFVGGVSLDRMPAILAETDICVFPSHWESFGLVCVESLAAARGVVASRAGGMFEILDGGSVGKVIPPRSPRHIARAVLELLNNPEERIRMGIVGRERIIECYNSSRIGKLQEASYHRAIEHRKQLGPRKKSIQIG